MNTRRCAVLMGGPSSERDVSLRTGQQVAEALGDEALPVVIEKDGRWRVGDEAACSVGRALDRLTEDCDVAFVALHGPFGEDGTVQGLLDAIGLPYAGSGVLGSALAMDKIRAKQVYQAAGLPTAPFEAVDRRRWRQDRTSTGAALIRLGTPAVIKPSASGSSFGVVFAKEAAEVAAAVDRLLGEVEAVLVEPRIVGLELSCGVLDDGPDAPIEALPVIEIVPDAKYDFFDYEAKYTPGATQEIVPARIEAELAARVQALAVEAHVALGCRDYSRSDFMIGKKGPVLLETNTLPGLTGGSLLPKAARAVGLELPALVRRLVEAARRRGPATFY
jgi:D-alanine-D-alanine ligase